MELKDVIMSTLAEMEDTPTPVVKKQEFSPKEKSVVQEEIVPIVKNEVVDSVDSASIESELQYLNSIKERLLVLFEGFQAPNNTNIEAKIDMTLNFLEYTLATIESRVDILEKRKR